MKKNFEPYIKQCTRCKEYMAITEFYWRNQRKSDRMCKTCQRKKAIEKGLRLRIQQITQRQQKVHQDAQTI